MWRRCPQGSSGLARVRILQSARGRAGRPAARVPTQTPTRPSPCDAVGTVRRVDAGYIALVVLGFVNALVNIKDVRAEFSYSLEEQCWASVLNPRHRIEAGTEVRFQLTK